MTERDIKRNLIKKVKFKNSRIYIDSEFLLIGATIRKNDNGYFYQAELQDLNNHNSIIICRLDEIEEDLKNERDFV